MKIRPQLSVIAAVLVTAACSSGSLVTSAPVTKPTAAEPVPATAAAKPTVTAKPASTTAAAAPSSKGCTAPTFDYIERDADPGAQSLAQEIGNCDLATGQGSLASFRQTAGQAPGECTTIALASDNPDYDANAVPAPPLKDVIESAGPGC
jgi:hypothetical protein